MKSKQKAQKLQGGYGDVTAGPARLKQPGATGPYKPLPYPDVTTLPWMRPGQGPSSDNPLNQAQQNYVNRFGQLPPALGGRPLPQGEVSGGPTPKWGGSTIRPLPGSRPDPGAVPGGGLQPPGWGGPPLQLGRPDITRRPTPFQGGTQEVAPAPAGPIGSPNPQAAYGPPINLSAPQLQMAAQKAGLSAGQIQGLMSAVQGFGSAYGAIGGAAGGYDVASPAQSQQIGDAFNLGAYQGGISDIGYPPFVAPGADYHADKGGWLGPYDPAYTFNSYARGIASVPFR